jgi:hypothetical protein
MPTPGSNLLKQAAKVIKLTPIQYYPFNSRTLNSARVWVPAFGDPITIMASAQAVPRSKYTFMGLDFQRNYIEIWAKYNIVDLERDVAGDQFAVYGKRFQIESQNTWWAQDGWSSGLAVEVSNA